MGRKKINPLSASSNKKRISSSKNITSTSKKSEKALTSPSKVISKLRNLWNNDSDESSYSSENVLSSSKKSEKDVGMEVVKGKGVNHRLNLMDNDIGVPTVNNENVNGLNLC